MAPARPSLVRLVLSLALALGGLVAVSGTAVADDPQAPALSLVTGTVTLSDGQAAASVTVSAAPKDGTSGTTTSVTTDAAGAYGLELATGTYTITYGLDRYETRTVEDVVVTTARTLDVVRLARLYALSGSVTFTDGTPAVGAQVQAWSEDDEDAPEVRTTVDAAGTFTLDLTYGWHEVYVSGRGVPAYWTSLFVSRDSRLDHVAVRTPSVTGTVTLSDGQSVAGTDAYVAIEQRVGGEWEMVDWVEIASDGTFEATLSPGDYRFEYWVDGYAARTVDVQVTTGDRTVDPVTLTRLPRVTGTVALGDGATIGDLDAWVQADRRRADGTWEVEHEYRSVRADGSFRLPLEAGTYRVTLAVDGYAEHVTTVVVGTADVALGTVTLARLPRVSGTVALADGRSHAVAGTTVTALKQDGTRWTPVSYAEVAPDGSYRLALPAGAYRLQFDADAYTAQRVEVDVTADLQVPAVTLLRRVALTGRLLLPGGASASTANGSVEVVRDRVVVGRATVRSDGSFSATVDQGRVVLRLSADGYAEQERTLDVTGATAVGDVTLAPPVLAKVTGTVVFDQTEGYGATIVLSRLRADGTLADSHEVWAPSGLPFELTVPTGTYRVTYAAEGHLPRSVDVVVGAGGTTLASVTLRLRPKPLHNVEAPRVTGAVAGGRATARPGRWSHTDARLSYQWYVDRAPVAGATSSTFSLAKVAAGRVVQVVVTASRTGEAAVDAASDEEIVQRPTVGFATDGRLSGRLAVGQTVRVVPGRTTPAGARLTYRWIVDGDPVPGATGPTLRLRPEHRGERVKVLVYAEAAGHLRGRQRIWPLAKVAKGTIAVRTRPSVRGTARVGRTLRASVGSYSVKPSTVRYQWLVGGRAVSGATGRTFRPTAAHAGRRVSVRVTVSAAGYTDRRFVSGSTRALAR